MKIYISIILILVFISCTNSNNTNVEKYSTINQYLKPGALVNIEYGNTKTDVNKILELTVIFITDIKNSNLNIEIKLVNNLNFSSKIDTILSIPTKVNQNKYPISMKVISKKIGISYINISVLLDDKMRTFSIPILVGKYKESRKLNNNSKFVIHQAVGTIIE